MFAINTRPLQQTRTVSDYACFLFEQFASPHYRAGVQEIHLVFDKPWRQAFNPKYSQISNNHQHCSFSISTSIPCNWQEHLHCQQCKRSVIEAIGLSLLQGGHSLIKDNQ